MCGRLAAGQVVSTTGPATTRRAWDRFALGRARSPVPGLRIAVPRCCCECCERVILARRLGCSCWPSVPARHGFTRRHSMHRNNPQHGNARQRPAHRSPRPRARRPPSCGRLRRDGAREWRPSVGPLPFCFMKQRARRALNHDCWPRRCPRLPARSIIVALLLFANPLFLLQFPYFLGRGRSYVLLLERRAYPLAAALVPRCTRCTPTRCGLSPTKY